MRVKGNYFPTKGPSMDHVGQPDGSSHQAATSAMGKACEHTHPTEQGSRQRFSPVTTQMSQRKPKNTRILLLV